MTSNFCIIPSVNSCSTNPSSFIDVHRFDGKWENNFTPSKNYTRDEKNEMFTALKSRLMFVESKQMIDLFINQHQIIDPSNNLDATDLLAEICVLLPEELLYILDEQLKDNFQLGQCPQGKTTRMMQIYRSIVNYSDEKQKQDAFDRERNVLESLMNVPCFQNCLDVKKRIISYFLTNDIEERNTLHIAIERFVSGDTLMLCELLN